MTPNLELLNDEIRMSKECLMTKSESGLAADNLRHSCFVILLDIRH